MTEKEQKDNDTAAKIRVLLEREGVIMEVDGRVAKGEELVAACERIVKDSI